MSTIVPLQRATPPIRMVAIGDSLTAGMMDANLDARTESMGYAQQFARQIGVPFNCPVIDGKGVPPRIFNQNHVDGLLIDEKAVYASDPHRDGKRFEFVLSSASVKQLNALHGGDD
ncbi:MAG: hypothetical protein ACYCW6_25985 [Candidatus Xenobia bacterium]